MDRQAVEVFDFLPYMMGDLEQRKPSGSSGLVWDFLIILGQLVIWTTFAIFVYTKCYFSSSVHQSHLMNSLKQYGYSLGSGQWTLLGKPHSPKIKTEHISARPDP